MLLMRLARGSEENRILSLISYQMSTTGGFPGGSDSKGFSRNVGDLGSIPGLGRPPLGGHSNPLQYSCLENPMDRRAWQGTVHEVAKSQT